MIGYHDGLLSILIGNAHLVRVIHGITLGGYEMSLVGEDLDAFHCMAHLAADCLSGSLLVPAR